MIGRIWMIAARDVKATLTNKGFLIGLIMMPAMILLGVTVVPRVLGAITGPQVTGDIAVIDASGRLLDDLRAALDPQAIAARRGRALAQSLGTAPPPFGGLAPRLTVQELAAGADLEAGKRWLLQQPQAAAAVHHLALAVIPADAVNPDSKAGYGTYHLYVAKGLANDTQMAIQSAVREALVATRMKIQGIDRAGVERMQDVAPPQVAVVAPEGEPSAQPLLRPWLPFICAVLLFITSMAGGQGLMMSMIEEKSSRVVEVLLAAVSPLELMAGKLLAQLSIGLLMLTVYVGLGLLALAQAAAVGAISPWLVADLAVMFLLAYLTFGALMLTIGAAVSSVADAQSLLGPVMMLLVIPFVLDEFIGFLPNAANSPWVVALSFVPPVNSFIMLARLASDAPPPFWQVPVTVALGLMFAAAVLWFAAKVFKIGLLMHGKPPSFATLLRWARMA